MKFRNEEAKKTIYFGGLCQSEYWQQFNNKTKKH